MGDREMLELAAKAAGKELHHWSDACNAFMCSDIEGGDPTHGWNPIANDGDAFRLAVKLAIRNTLILSVGCGGADCEFNRVQRFAFEHHGRDPLAATRRAIVRAAAEIGMAPNAVLTGRGPRWFGLNVTCPRRSG